MNRIRTTCILGAAAVLVLSTLAASASKNPLAHVDIKTVKSYQGQSPLPKPARVIVFDFTVAPEVVKTDRMPGVRQRMKGNSKEAVSKQIQNEISKDLIKGLQKQLKNSGIPVEKGTPGMDVPGNSLTIRGTVTKLDQGHRMRRGSVGLGVGASDVETNCQIAVETDGKSEMLSELSTVAKSGKKPGVGVTMGAGAAPAVAAGVTGATAHKSTAQGDSARTGSALAKRTVQLMKAQGWIAAGNQKEAAEGQAK